MHICTKYEVSMFKPVARRCAQIMPMMMPMMTMPTHNGQSMIVYGSLVDKPNVPKIICNSIKAKYCISGKAMNVNL